MSEIVITLRNINNGEQWPLFIQVYENSLSRKWLAALVDIVQNQLHLEKNYCFMGFPDSARSGPYILEQINKSIQAINQAQLGYEIVDEFTMENSITDEPQGHRVVGRNIIHERFNQLHRYFEDLQGTSGNISQYYQRANADTRWHIRQLNLLCHEFECWALSWRKQLEAPDWMRPSTLMCWLKAPRFILDEEDYQLFGVETLNRPLGGVFVGVNKAIGKHHWEVFNDEGNESRLSELTTTSLRSQTEAAGDFDIEWGQNPESYPWQQQRLEKFRHWLIINGFDPDDRSLTIGHPLVAQVDLDRSFGTNDHHRIWNILSKHLDVVKLSIDNHEAYYDYHWNDSDYQQQQIDIIKQDEKLC